jgi:membrane-bound lytic murein transglycosylase D
MYNKRLLLLGITIIGSGWMYPNQAENLITQKDGSFHSTGDTTEKVTGNVNAATLTAAVNSNSEDLFSKELFVAASIGGSNGVRLNPKALGFVADYMKDNWDELQDMRSWGRPYFNLIENVLTQYGLPRELKYLAVIESNLKPTALSKVGAVGPWQLMPQTARDLGLKVARGNDAIRRSVSRNFWDLQYYLPAESRIHVKKFIGTQYTFEGQGSVTTLTREEATEQLSGSSMYVFHRKLNVDELNNARTVSISGKYHSSVIARYTLLDSATFSRYNPDFDKVMASSNNSYDLKLPADKMELFAANKYQILNESVQLLLNGDEQTGITGQGVASK